MASVYSVSQINSYIKNMFRQDYALNRVSVQGEVSNCKYHPTGHIYFTLKDSGGTLSAVMFSGRRSGLSFVLKDGMQVIVTGSIEVYERAGTYQIYAQQIRQAGLGDLYERFVRLRNRLEEMGMFAPEYKQPIPKYVRTVGIVTASSGAALQDIINIASRRNPYVQLILSPAQVQGEGAAESIAAAIERLDRIRPDVMIVGRGGGSLEDLWAFNEEIVARAVFDASTPVISAVGHETDFTITDYVADLRAPTPSAAAELAVFDMAAFERSIANRADRLTSAAERLVRDARGRAERKSMMLQRYSPQSRTASYRMRHDELASKLSAAMKAVLDERKKRSAESERQLPVYMQRLLVTAKHGIAIRAEKLEGVSPLRKISSGYAWVSLEDETHVMRAGDLERGDIIRIGFTDGRVTAEVIGGR